MLAIPEPGIKHFLSAVCILEACLPAPFCLPSSLAPCSSSWDHRALRSLHPGLSLGRSMILIFLLFFFLFPLLFFLILQGFTKFFREKGWEGSHLPSLGLSCSHCPRPPLKPGSSQLPPCLSSPPLTAVLSVPPAQTAHFWWKGSDFDPGALEMGEGRAGWQCPGDRMGGTVQCQD